VETSAPGEGLLICALPVSSVVVPPGHRLVSGLGSAQARARGLHGLVFGTFAGFLGWFGGRGYARWRADLRRAAFQRMIQKAEAQEPGAVVGVTFQSHERLFCLTTMVCSGVTVRIAPIPGADIAAAPADPAAIERYRAAGIVAHAEADAGIPPERVSADESLPGWRVLAVVGLVQAAAVQWDIAARRGHGSLRSGGTLADAWQDGGAVAQARARLLGDAAKAGANGVIGLHATVHRIAPGITEALCLGTAVVVAHAAENEAESA
jgi:uncharacterized protein YbjQ (UPF0145 family)